MFWLYQFSLLPQFLQESWRLIWVMIFSFSYFSAKFSVCTTKPISSVAQSCLTLCDTMNCSTPGLPVHHQSTHGACSNSHPLSWWWHPTISSSVVPFSSCLQSFPAISSVQFSSVAQSCLTLCDTMNCSTPGLPVHHQLPEFTQTLCVYWVIFLVNPTTL